MNAAKKTTDAPVSEQLTEILHRLKHLEKGQKEIKSHLWRTDPTEKPDEKADREIVRQDAINYINSVVMPEIEAAQAEKGEIGTQGITDWLISQLAKPVAEYLKAQIIQYIGDALGELKKKAIPYAVQIADWILDKLENVLVAKYNEASSEQRELFKQAIEEHFPNSRLLGKL